MSFGRFFVILAVIFALALPASGAFASSMMMNCKCPASSHCSDKCDSAKCHVPVAPSFVGHEFSAEVPVALGTRHAVALFSFVATSLPSSLFKPPRLV